MTLLPAVMGLCGRRNWSLPSWLDAVLPHLSMEGPATDLDDRAVEAVGGEVKEGDPVAVG
jgi:putative drug exporter of the RND superfamily